LPFFLSAIAQIETDSFEARGVVYDRLWRMVVEQLRDAHDHPDEMIAVERAAFLRAVQAIEFGTKLPATPSAASAPLPRRAATGLARKPERRPLLGRIALRMVAACAALALIWFGYVLTVVRLDSTAATRWGDGSVPNSWQSQVMRAARSLSHLIDRQPEVTASVGQRAVLYEESATTATGNTFSGHAIWRHHVESTSEPPTVVLSIDVAIPQKSIMLQMSLKRAPEGGAISHFVSFNSPIAIDRSPTWLTTCWHSHEDRRTVARHRARRKDRESADRRVSGSPAPRRMWQTWNC
jgi:hypothetical protein